MLGSSMRRTFTGPELPTELKIVLKNCDHCDTTFPNDFDLYKHCRTGCCPDGHRHQETLLLITVNGLDFLAFHHHP